MLPPYKIIADCFRDHSVVPFLGAAASFIGAVPEAAALPSGAQFAQHLGAAVGYPGSLTDSLSKVAQYLEDIPADRGYLLSTICQHFHEQVAHEYGTSVTQFLRTLPKSLIPRLIITTNYDVLVERALEQRGVPYLAISHIMRTSQFSGRFLCSSSTRTALDASNIRTLQEVEEQLMEAEESQLMPILVYKMHGTALARLGRDTIDSVIMTENDYVDFFVYDLLNRIPSRIIELLRTNRLLFLGYSLEDWNFRVLLGKLRRLQAKDGAALQRHWALLLSDDSVEHKFWERRGVNLYNHSLDDFLAKLSTFLGDDLRVA